MHYSIQRTGAARMEQARTGTAATALPVAQFISAKHPGGLVAVWKHTRARPQGRSVAIYRGGKRMTFERKATP